MNRIKEMGYTIKDACKAIGISRSWYYYLVYKAKNTTKNIALLKMFYLVTMDVVKKWTIRQKTGLPF